MQKNSCKSMHSEMLIPFRAGPRSTVTVEPCVLMDESKRDEFGKSTSAPLDGAQQKDVAHPISRLFDVPVHHGRSRGDAQFVRGGDDFHPSSGRQFEIG